MRRRFGTAPPRSGTRTARSPGGSGASRGTGSTLTWGVVAGAVLVLPLAPAAGGGLWHPGVLAAGLGLAVLSAVLLWSLDQAALRRLPERTVAVMVSLEPAAGAVAGLVLLGEHLAWTRWLAIGCVCAASSGAALGHRERGT
ncbi:Threonine/homoserine exporter RhtA [Actinomadura sp. RB99]|nr:EamA family transporter [Actinomadura sp. RB99]MBD2895544.1 Threonine/homoserine exporter RhtA [Actinomadura sp. RB99]